MVKNLLLVSIFAPLSAFASTCPDAQSLAINAASGLLSPAAPAACLVVDLEEKATDYGLIFDVTTLCSGRTSNVRVLVDDTKLDQSCYVKAARIYDLDK